MPPVVVQGGIATLQATGLWEPEGVWEVIFQSLDLSMTMAGELPVVLTSDVEVSFLGQTMAYTDDIYSSTPGTVTIIEAEAVAGFTVTTMFREQPALMLGATGTFTAEVVLPATLIDGYSVETDEGVKEGIWTVSEPGQVTFEAT